MCCVVWCDDSVKSHTCQSRWSKPACIWLHNNQLQTIVWIFWIFFFFGGGGCTVWQSWLEQSILCWGWTSHHQLVVQYLWKWTHCMGMQAELIAFVDNTGVWNPCWWGISPVVQRPLHQSSQSHCIFPWIENPWPTPHVRPLLLGRYDIRMVPQREGPLFPVVGLKQGDD